MICVHGGQSLIKSQTGSDYIPHPPPDDDAHDGFAPAPLENTENIFSVSSEWQFGHSGAFVSPIFRNSLKTALQCLHLNSYTGI